MIFEISAADAKAVVAELEMQWVHAPTRRLLAVLQGPGIEHAGEDDLPSVNERLVMAGTDIMIKNQRIRELESELKRVRDSSPARYLKRAVAKWIARSLR